MNISDFFASPTKSTHKQYEALRAYFYEKQNAQIVAKKFGYTIASLYSLTRDFKKQITDTNNQIETRFFIDSQVGRKPREDHDELYNLIVLLRKKYLSVADIKSILDAQKKDISEKQIYNIIKTDGFARLPRRNKITRHKVYEQVPIVAPKSCILENTPDEFNTQNAGILCFLQYIKSYGVDQIISDSNYPQTNTLPRLNSILAFIALKLANIRRYTADDLWCMDRGLGLFAGLNVLPKAAWYTSYSHRITREMNLNFLKNLHILWKKRGLLSDTANLDFVAVPYWGDDSHLENNWSGTRHKALASILAAIVNDPDTGIISYGDTSVRHDNEADVIIEFLDFYKSAENNALKYLIFDSKFTVYENLAKLDDNGVKFITIRKRGKKIVHDIELLPKTDWKSIRVQTSNGKTRLLKVNEQIFFLKGYNRQIRQITITGNGKIKPALIITNDFELELKDVIRKYALRWLVEKAISEQTHFFHLNRVSSSMVVKVDFDLTMTILAHNIYKLLAIDLPGYSHYTAQSLYDKFINNSGVVKIESHSITVSLKKKRNLPAILTAMQKYLSQKFNWLNNCKLFIEGATYS